MVRQLIGTGMLNRRRALAGLGSGAAALALGPRLAWAQAGTPAATPSTGPVSQLRIGLIPAEDMEAIIRQFEPLTAYLRAELEVEDFEVFRATDYTAVIEAMRGGKLDLAWFGPFSYVLAHEVADARSLVMAGTADGEPATYHSLIVTTPGTGITDLEGLRGRTFSFVDPASTSGNLIPRSLLVENGIDPDADMEAIYAGGHDASMLAVLNGRVDAGAVSDVTFEQLIREEQATESDFVIIAESDPIPESPFATRADMDPGLRERIRQVMLRAHEELGEETVSAILEENGARFVDSPDELYDPLREVVETLDLDLAELAS